MSALGRIGWVLGILAFCGCEKVPLDALTAEFTLADATWFADEQTLFFFYRVTAEQGLGPESQIEVTWRTDDVRVPWTAVSALSPVHLHEQVDCGAKGRCGSTSLKVVGVPREVGLRLRYHRDGELTRDATVMLNVIDSGPPHTNRSLAVYGVFDETNNHVQWRARHQFPTLRNEQAQELGLRRTFQILDPQAGDLWVPPGNPYGYAFAASCPGGMMPLGWQPSATSERAIFESTELPLSTSTAPLLCARSVVVDAKGTFEAAAVARKNPQVRAAFPALRSPIRADTSVGFVLRPCALTISEPHLKMQIQRLLLTGAPEICIDNWRDPGFAADLVTRFRARIDEVRAQGNDMVLTIALHHDDTSGKLADAVENALEQVLPFESAKSSPRLSGAFIFDSFSHTLVRPALRRLVLWCPANLDLEDLDLASSAAQRSCPLLPDLPDIKLGPFKFSNLAILPTRAQYLKFIGKYSDAQAGRMEELQFLAPERTPISQNLPLGDFAVATLFNNEILTAAPSDAFSFCAGGDERAASVIFRSVAAPTMPLPIGVLPQFHEAAHESSYALGLLWDFPFLLRLKYQVTVAGAATVFAVTVPFGISSTDQAYYGTTLWQTGEFALNHTLLQCTRFCDHPTFDSAGVYNVNALFRAAFGNQCYRPKYPALGEGGFPLDP
jgi:hypothetical protein